MCRMEQRLRPDRLMRSPPFASTNLEWLGIRRFFLPPSLSEFAKDRVPARVRMRLHCRILILPAFGAEGKLLRGRLGIGAHPSSRELIPVLQRRGRYPMRWAAYSPKMHDL
jgi:hypothetical protein